MPIVAYISSPHSKRRRLNGSHSDGGYTGDTEWIDTLIEAGRDADPLTAECYTYDRKVRFHLDYATLKEEPPRINANV